MKALRLRQTTTLCTAKTLQIRRYSAPIDFEVPEAKRKYVPTSGTYPKGFRVGSTHVGVKPSNTKYPDLVMIASDNLCNAAAITTNNMFTAAPVKVTRRVESHRGGLENQFRGVIINSGCANAVTGARGWEDALRMANTADSCFVRGPKKNQPTPRSFVMSTGVIGQTLPIDKISSAIPTVHEKLDSTHGAWLAGARAICTTDTFPKLVSRTFTLPSTGGTIYSIAGMAKGAGMIHPNMGTLLSVICTDAPIQQNSIRELLSKAVNCSFNRISIDGDTSTNDTVALFANGSASPESTFLVHSEMPDWLTFLRVLGEITQDLAKLIVRDGEGATKFVRVYVKNAKTRESAKNVAESIARSPLVKTALYGQDANFGRILCAIGYSQMPTEGQQIKEDRISIIMRALTDDRNERDANALHFMRRGVIQPVDEAMAAELLKKEDLEIVVDLGYPKGNGDPEQDWGRFDHYYFCDFSHEYVTINGDYRT